ncbi:MAG: leucine-rich repeat protein [Clostridia bacterium]|nr:leucine-rich repeat protein [Clostridia bacterium]
MNKKVRLLSFLICVCIVLSSFAVPSFAASALPESAHPYKNNMEGVVTSYIYDGENADQVEALKIYFSSNTATAGGFDIISIFGSNHLLIGDYSGRSLAGKSVIVPGKAVYISLTTDASGTAYGYKVVKVDHLFPVTYSFDTCGGTAVDDIYTSYLKAFPHTYKEGMFFAGWYDNPEYSGKPLTLPYGSDSDITLYAAWSDEPYVNIDDYEYEIKSDNTVTLMKYLGSDETVYLPEEIGGLPVTTVFSSAFKDAPVATVKIGAGITNIDNYAFNECYTLRNIDVDENNSVYSSKDGVLFDKSGKKLVKCPPAYEGEFIISDGVTSLNAGVFDGCIKLSGVKFNSAVSTIPAYAFRNCQSLTAFEIPEKVTTVGERAFDGCTALSDISLHNNVQSIGKDAFVNTALYNDISNWKDGILLYEDGYLLACKKDVSANNIRIDEGTVSIASYVFYKNEFVQTVTFPESLDRVGDYAFFGCLGLEEAALPDGLTTLGNHAFAKCTALKSVVVPDSVTSLGKIGLFDGNTALETAEIGFGVTELPANIFRNCTALKTVTITGSLKKIGKTAFSGCSSLADVYFKGKAEQWSSLNIDVGNEAFTALTPHFIRVETWKKGDVNNDGKINVADMFILKSFILGSRMPDEDETYAADINGDGKINPVDGHLTIQLILGIISVG